MSKDKDSNNPEDSDDELVIRIGEDDSALVVRTNGEIELISRELREQQEEAYVGDIEDLNRTFTLVLAFAAALENEKLYHQIFQNLNHVLHKQWDKLPPDEKLRIQNIRSQTIKDKNPRNKEEWLNKWREEIERGRQSLEDYMNQHPDEREVGGPFGPEMMEPPRRKRKKLNPLAKLKDMNWNPNDETLKANRVDGPHSAFRGDWNLDSPPPEDN